MSTFPSVISEKEKRYIFDFHFHSFKVENISIYWNYISSQITKILINVVTDEE